MNNEGEIEQSNLGTFPSVTDTGETKDSTKHTFTSNEAIA